MKTRELLSKRFLLASWFVLAASAWPQTPAPDESAKPEPGSVAQPAETTPSPVAAAPAVPAPPAPMRVGRGAKLFIEPSEFGMAVSAAILKKKVPVVAIMDKDKADFFVQTTSSATTEKGGERVAKILMFGAFAGSGRRFEGTVTIANRDGAIIFAHNSKKENFQSAAENVAKNLSKHIAGE